MRKGINNMYQSGWNPSRGELIHTQRKTPKQKEKVKKLNSQLDKINKQVGVVDKEINKFKKQHKEIFDKLDTLQLKSDNLSERWTNKWDIVTDYEEKFKTYDNDGNDYRY